MGYAHGGEWGRICITKPAPRPRQLEMELGQMPKAKPRQSRLPFESSAPSPAQIQEVVDEKGFIRPEHLFKLEGHWRLMAKILKQQEKKCGRKDWRCQYQALVQYRDELSLLLHPLLEGMLPRVKGSNIYEEWLELLTLMSWASALVYIGKEKEHWHLCCEVDILDRKRWGLHGGRIDGCRVVLIGGKKPTDLQQQRIANLFRSQRFRSVAEVQRATSKHFKEKIIWEVVDWKWAIGDAVSKDGVIRAEQVARKPIAKHLNQMIRYQMFWCIDTHHRVGNDLEAFWSRSNLRIPRGRIIYLFPDRLPVVHQIRSDRIALHKFWTKYQKEREKEACRNWQLREVQKVFARWPALVKTMGQEKPKEHPCLFEQKDNN